MPSRSITPGRKLSIEHVRFARERAQHVAPGFGAFEIERVSRLPRLTSR